MRLPLPGHARPLGAGRTLAAATPIGAGSPGGRGQCGGRRAARRCSQQPWAVALASRDRFGGSAVRPVLRGRARRAPTVVTAAHCLGREVLGVPWRQVRDLRVITGRTDLRRPAAGDRGPRRWVNPDYDSWTNAGDIAVLTLAERAPASAVDPDGRAGRPGVPRRAATARSTAGGTPRGRATMRHGCGRHASVCCRTRSARRPTRGARTARTGRLHAVRRGAPAAGGTPARETAEGRWWRRGGWSGWCPGGPAAVRRAARGLHARLVDAPGGIGSRSRSEGAKGSRRFLDMRVRAASPVVSGETARQHRP